MEDYRELLGDEFCLSAEESRRNYQRAMARMFREKLENDKVAKDMKVPDCATLEPMKALFKARQDRIDKWKAKVSDFLPDSELVLQ